MYREIKDENFDYRSVVIKGYDNCAEKYQNERRDENEPSLSYLFDNVPAGGEVLDAGCGSGLPVCRLLSEKYRTTGIDISSKQIELARKNVPGAEFINTDILEYKRPDSSLDAIVSYYALFHIPREKHRKVLDQFHHLLKPGAVLIITLAHRSEKPYTEDDFFDETMYWSNYGIDEYRTMLAEIGFSIVSEQELGHGYEDPTLMAENHPLVVAVKQNSR